MVVESDKWVVLWSPHQDAFHSDTFASMLEENRAIFERGDKGDFILMGIRDSKEESDLLIEKLKKHRDKRNSN